MEKMRGFVYRHKVISYISAFGVIVLFNCFGFPIYNLNKDWPLMLTILKIYVVLATAWMTGEILHGLFLKKTAAFIIFMATLLSLSGLICRYFLEFGEVSNTYNFTLPNIMLHLVISVSLACLTWVYTSKKIIIIKSSN